MGSESTSRVEVRKSKSRKRTKKKNESKGIPEKDDTKGEDFNEETAVRTKHKAKKRKSNNHSDTENRKIKNKDEEHDFDDVQNNENEETIDNEAKPKKKLKNTCMDNKDIVEETEEMDQSNPKVSKKPSIRQMKREKAEKKEMERREASRLEAMQRGLNYVSKWKHARSEWKFEKLRQIWLMDNLLDQNSIPDDIFPTVLEYFEGCKGMAREQLLKKGMDIIRKAEEDEENRDEIMETVAYKRARQLLQALPTET